MIPVMCIVQEGQISPEAEHGMKAQISAFTQRAFSETADIDWIVVARGNGFTSAAPSTSVIASLHANRALAQSERLALITELGYICAAQSGRTLDEVFISVRDPAPLSNE